MKSCRGREEGVEEQAETSDWESDGPLQHYPEFLEDMIETSHDTQEGIEDEAGKQVRGAHNS